MKVSPAIPACAPDLRSRKSKEDAGILENELNSEMEAEESTEEDDADDEGEELGIDFAALMAESCAICFAKIRNC